ncbi:KRAB-A domain-containing protein 2-like [Palaemon carinicauda]|uniref:KRAB-A domain-containing protein 2-like n=1 Tax=Palaemon carinicauda TaxID=392227 RepID=UPI0035B5ABBB
MLKNLQKKYTNIPTKAVELFKSLCQECQKKRKRPMTKGFSDNGSEFTSQVITEVKEVWPKLTLVYVKPRHHGSVERANGDIKDMLVAWMADNDSQDWPTGIMFVSSRKTVLSTPG